MHHKMRRSPFNLTMPMLLRISVARVAHLSRPIGHLVQEEKIPDRPYIDKSFIKITNLMNSIKPGNLQEKPFLIDQRSPGQPSKEKKAATMLTGMYAGVPLDIPQSNALVTFREQSIEENLTSAEAVEKWRKNFLKELPKWSTLDNSVKLEFYRKLSTLEGQCKNILNAQKKKDPKKEDYPLQNAHKDICTFLEKNETDFKNAGLKNIMLTAGIVDLEESFIAPQVKLPSTSGLLTQAGPVMSTPSLSTENVNPAPKENELEKTVKTFDFLASIDRKYNYDLPQIQDQLTSSNLLLSQQWVNLRTNLTITDPISSAGTKPDPKPDHELPKNQAQPNNNLRLDQQRLDLTTSVIIAKAEPIVSAETKPEPEPQVTPQTPEMIMREAKIFFNEFKFDWGQRSWAGRDGVVKQLIGFAEHLRQFSLSPDFREEPARKELADLMEQLAKIADQLMDGIEENKKNREAEIKFLDKGRGPADKMKALAQTIFAERIGYIRAVKTVYELKLLFNDPLLKALSEYDECSRKITNVTQYARFENEDARENTMRVTRDKYIEDGFAVTKGGAGTIADKYQALSEIQKKINSQKFTIADAIGILNHYQV